MSGECYHGFAFFVHLDMIIGEPIGSGIIDQGIDMWQWKVILMASPVQIPVVDAHTSFLSFLGTGTMLATQSE